MLKKTAVYCAYISLFFLKNFSIAEQKKPLTPFEQALANLYAQNPQLLQQPLQDNEENKTFFSYVDKKKVLSILSDIVPLLFFFYKSYHNVVLYQKNSGDQSMLQKTVEHIFPSILINTPKHINLFLFETELVMQAYLLKLMLKMVIFCFL